MNYPEIVLLKAFKSTQKVSWKEAYRRKPVTSSDRVKLMLPFHFHGQTINTIICRHLSLLQLNTYTRVIFSDLPKMTYKWKPNLNYILVHNHLNWDPAFVSSRETC